MLERYGLAELADRSVHSLSGGQRQLLAMAGVLATDPDVLVADEPTTLLDLRNTRAIADLLFGLPQQLVLVTHDLDLALRCDRALLVDDGRVVADGRPDEVVDDLPEPGMSLLGLYRPGTTWLHRLPASRQAARPARGRASWSSPCAARRAGSPSLAVAIVAGRVVGRRAAAAVPHAARVPRWSQWC